MKIGFVTDTNILEKVQDELFASKGILDSTDIFTEYIKDLKEADVEKELMYFMPESILEELFTQRRIMFNEKYDKFRSSFLDMQYGLIGEMPTNNFESFVQKEKGKYYTKFKIIKLNYTAELLENLVNEAIQKKPPFDKSLYGKKSDAGFKDAIIWKTILQSKEIDECNLFYLFSCDKIFYDNQDYLYKDFKSIHKNTELKIVYFDPDGNQRQNVLQLLISENKLVETTVVKLYDKELILSNINQIKYDYSEEVAYINENKTLKLINILFNEFTIKDFFIDDVNEKNGKYEVVLSFKTSKYILDDSQEEKTRKLLGTIKLYFNLSNKRFELTSYKVDNVRFYSNQLNKLFSSIGESVAKIYSDEFKKSMESLRKALEINLEPLKDINFTSQLEDIKKALPAFDSIKEITNSLNSSKQFEELRKSLLAANDIVKSAHASNPIKYLDTNRIEDKSNKN